jgi:hypothetical protein
MLFAPVYPGVRDPGEFGSYIHYSPPTLPCRLFFSLEGLYNALALGCHPLDVDFFPFLEYNNKIPEVYCYEKFVDEIFS